MKTARDVQASHSILKFVENKELKMETTSNEIRWSDGLFWKIPQHF